MIYICIINTSCYYYLIIMFLHFSPLYFRPLDIRNTALFNSLFPRPITIPADL